MQGKQIEPWQIAAARFCVERKEFTVKELQDFLKGDPYNIPEQVSRIYFTESIQHTAGRQHGREYRQTEAGGLWTAPLEMVSMITDFDELREARKNAKEARDLAVIAISVSVGAALASIVMPILVAQWFTQDVRLPDDQLKQIVKFTSSTSIQ